MSFRNESVAEFMFNAFSEVRGLGQRPGGLAVADSVGPLGSTVRVFQAAGCTESDLDCLLKLTTSEVIAAQVSASQNVPSINALAVRVVCVLLRLPHPCLMFCDGVQRFDPWTPIAGASGALHQPIHSWVRCVVLV